jgi:tetratricopeptide (TPR) repeat protein
MLGLKLSSLKKETVKASGLGSFVNMIPDIKKKSEFNQEQLNDNYNNALSEVLEILGELSTNFTRGNFEKAIDKLYDAQKLKSNKAEPYFYLAWLFLFADEIELALKYMKVTSALNPEFEGLNILKDKISEIQLLDTKLQNDYSLTPDKVEKPVSIEQPRQLASKITSNLNTARVYSAYSFSSNRR